MKLDKNARLYKSYSCDFETTNDENDCRVWAAIGVNIGNYEVEVLCNNIDEWFKWLFRKNSCYIYFHNLRFDGEFCLSWLLQNGFTYGEKKDKTFSTIISDMGQWYCITIYKELRGKVKKYKIMDSLKKLPFSVSRIAKTFNLEESKLSIDYNEYRSPEHVLTDEEKEYIKADAIIVAKALHLQFEKGLRSMTIASDSMTWFKDKSLFGRDFRSLFPIIPDEWDRDIRQSYRGGFTYVNPKYANIRGLKGISFDVNSLYPSRMYNEQLPWGIPVKFSGSYKYNRRYPLYIIHFSCCFDLKNGYLPTLQIKRNPRFVATEYLTTSDGDIIDLWMTSVDYELFREHYEVSSVKYYGGYMFRRSKGIFTEYIDYWMHIKENTTGGERVLAKLQLNSLYGKFASITGRINKVPSLACDGTIELDNSNEEIVDPIYTAMACFITAYARRVTISSAQKLKDRFIYADTDSLYLEGYEIPDNLEIHDTKLGAWKQEHTFDDSYFIRPKTYAINDINEGFIVKAAGLPEMIKNKINFSNFMIGSKFEGKLMPKRVKGGIVLKETTFTIK